MTIQLYELVGKDKTRPFSPHCWKVRMALAHKGLDFDMVPTGFLDVPKVENGLGKIVPVIRDGDKVLNDSFQIALYLDQAYPDKPSLFGGEGGKAMAKFIESWALANLHMTVAVTAVEEIGEMLEGADKDYFVSDREKRFGKPLSDVTAMREGFIKDLPNKIKPLGMMLASQPFIGGDKPLFADYIVFGALQWARICSKTSILPADDPVTEWFERCLDLFDGMARKIPAACD